MTSLHEFLRRQVESPTLPGAVALVARGDEIECAAAGTLDVEGSPPIARDTVFRIASLSKPITAAALLMVVEDGLVGLDDPIRRWLPELAEPSVVRSPQSPIDDVVPADRAITVEDLLSFRAGWGYAADFSLPAVQPLFGLGGAPRGDALPATDDRVGVQVGAGAAEERDHPRLARDEVVVRRVGRGQRLGVQHRVEPDDLRLLRVPGDHRGAHLGQRQVPDGLVQPVRLDAEPAGQRVVVDLVAPFEDGDQQRVLGAEVVQQSGVGDPTGGGDVVHRDTPETALADQPGGRVDDLGAPVAGREALPLGAFRTGQPHDPIPLVPALTLDFGGRYRSSYLVTTKY
jgi:hypothetical protein